VRFQLRPALLAALTFGSALLVSACNGRPAATIADVGFEKQANQLCAEALPKLRAERRKSDLFGTTSKDDRTKTASRVEEVTDGLDALADRLGNLPVRNEDQAEVAAWLEEWANYTAIGRQYAAAVRTERASVYTSIATQGNDSVRRIARFARANHIDSCVL
jgi:hypothetical protein